MTLQLSLKEARKHVKITAQKLADILGTNRASLYRAESGECLTNINLCRRMRAHWPMGLVSDLAIYDPKEFERCRARK